MLEPELGQKFVAVVLGELGVLLDELLQAVGRFPSGRGLLKEHSAARSSGLRRNVFLLEACHHHQRDVEIVVGEDVVSTFVIVAWAASRALAPWGWVVWRPSWG